MELSGGTIVWRVVVTVFVAASLFFVQAALTQPPGQPGSTPLQDPAQTEPTDGQDGESGTTNEDKSTADFDDDETTPTTTAPVGREVGDPEDAGDSTDVLGESTSNDDGADPDDDTSGSGVADDMDAAEGIVGDPQFTG